MVVAPNTFGSDLKSSRPFGGKHEPARHDRPEALTLPGPHGGQLNVIGLCSYCETPTQATCRLCGRSVGPDHTLEEELLCLDCARGRSLD